MSEEQELIQYYIVNKDLNMSAGKIASQVAHVATIIAIEDSVRTFKRGKLFRWYE